jgi:histone H3/H4
MASTSNARAGASGAGATTIGNSSDANSLHGKRTSPAIAGLSSGGSSTPASVANVEPNAEHFARSIALMSAAHIARGVGFESVQRSAGDALAEILGKYIQRIGVAAKDIAEHAGRTQPQATDVAMALEDMLPVPMDLPDLIKTLQTAKRPFPRGT